MTIVLEDENGNAIQTIPEELTIQNREKFELDHYSLLKYIDFFGDTTFNCLQLDDLQNEFEKFKLETVSQKEVIQSIIEMIISSRKKTHSYVKFYGDQGHF